MSLIRQAFCLAGSALVFLAAGATELPEGFLTLPPETVIPAPNRNWERLGISEREIRLLDRFHRGGGYEGWHIAYKSDDLNITGILARPYIKLDEVTDKPLTRFPAIILNHGSDLGVTAPYRAIALEFARRGYVVAASAYRGRGAAEGRSEGIPQYAQDEVLDVFQLTELTRKLDYVDSLRMGIVGFGEGATITVQVAARSNVFRAAVAAFPAVFSASPEFGFAGMMRLREIDPARFAGLSESALLSELRARESLLYSSRMTTPLMLITSEADPGFADQMKLIENLARRGRPHRLARYPGMTAGFLTASSGDGLAPTWRQYQESAWREIFSFFEENVPPNPPEGAETSP